MPELPEVEIVVRCLDRLIKGRTVQTAELRRKLLAPNFSKRSFAAKLKSSLVNFVHRRGKHILFDLDTGRTLIAHLRMSGRFMILSADEADPKFTHAVFYLDGDERLVFQDQRHFGFMNIVDTGKLFETKELACLAPEPFSDEFSVDYFRDLLRASKRNIKQLLLDQTKVCGVGNIYASEAMFIARVNPLRIAGDISGKKKIALHSAIREVMNETLLLGKNIRLDRQNIGGGIYGSNVESEWRIYGREGEPCPFCSKPIARIVQGTRSTFLCSKCQR